MKILFDFLPIVVFFVAYKFLGIYIATGAAIGVSLIQLIFHWFKHREITTLQWINFLLLLILGGGTLLLHDEWLIKWKPTALNWVFAIAFWSTQLFSEKPLIQRLMEKNLQLPTPVWSTLNTSWIAFFIIMGATNLFVAYHFDTNTWVNFKLFGMMGLTFIFAVLQAVYLARYLKSDINNA